MMQISIYVIDDMPEPGRNLAADAYMGRTQLSPCIYNLSTRTIRASKNAMPAWYFFHAEPLISRFSLEKYITLLQQLWQTVLMWNLYPIFISLNQLAVKITPAESFLWMHLHQFQYLCRIGIEYYLLNNDDNNIIYWIMMIIMIMMMMITIMIIMMTMMIIGTATIMIMIIIITTTLTMTIMKMIKTAQTPCQSLYKDRRI